MKNVNRLSLTIICFILLSLNSYSVEKKDLQILNDNLPLFMGASNAGKEFFLTFHPCWDEAGSPNNSIRIYVSSNYHTNVKLEIPALGIIRTKEIKPNQTVEFPLLVSEALLYTKGSGAEAMPPQPEGVGIGRAIIITADDPIICYGMVRFQYTSDGYLAIPINNWGKNYQVASYMDPTDNISQFLPSFTSIVAAYDNTEVNFKLGGSTTQGALLQNNDTLEFGETLTRVLNKGDVWLIPGIGPFNDLSGSQISADKNIGVISGNFCANVPNYISACDYIIEQDVPSDYWGKNYFIPLIVNRKKASIVKIFAKEPNTTILLNNTPLFNITKLDGKEGTGYIETRTTQDSTPSNVEISSDKEINVVLYNPGQNDDNVASDPFQMNIVSDAQYQNNITFSTPGIRGGFGFTENYLNIIFKSKNALIPDDIYFAENYSDTIQWIQLNKYTSGPLTSFDNEIADEFGYLHYSMTIKLPHDGVFKLKAKEPFAAHGYGYSNFDSYGYPLSGGMIDQTNGDTLKPEIKIVNLGSGNYEGQITELGNPDNRVSKNPEKLQNNSVASGYTFIDIINSNSYNYKFERDNFIPGESKVINYKLTKIIDYEGSKAVIYVSDRRGNDTTLIFEDIVGSRQLIPVVTADNTDFGIVKNGQKKQISFNITNKSQVDSKPIKEIVFEKQINGFSIVSNSSFPLNLKPNEEIELIIEFVGGLVDSTFINKIGLKTEDTTFYNIEFKATVSNPLINTTDIDFSSYVIGSSAENNNIIITNYGKTNLEINKIDFPKYGAFKLQINPPSKEYPLIVPAEKSLKIEIEFDPKVEGNYKDTIVFYSDGKIIKNISYLKGNAIINSVDEFESKFGIINSILKDNKLTFISRNDIILQSYSMYDINGKIIFSGSPSILLNNFILTLNRISSSVCFIELNTQYGRIIKKIIID